MTVLQKITFSRGTLRITALWAFSEAFLGGLLHAFKIPFAGLVLAWLASCCICLIAWQQQAKGTILKATLLVLAIKFMFSPHTPPMAYAAVLIQGLAGELLLLNRKQLPVKAFLLTVFSLLYSAFQHLLVLTIVFGSGLWPALDQFLNKITRSFLPESTHYSLYLVGIYLAVYTLAALAGGWLNFVLLKQLINPVSRNRLKAGYQLQHSTGTAVILPANSASRKKKRRPWLVILMALCLLASYAPPINSWLNQNKLTELLLRGILVLATWTWLLAPLLLRGIQHWLKRYSKHQSEQLEQVLDKMPAIRSILSQSWKQTSVPGKWQHVKKFIPLALLSVLEDES